MRRVDDVAVSETGPQLLQMMENAGRNLARNAMAARPGLRSVTVLAGPGGNGGGGLCAARHLTNHGIDVTVVLDRDPDDLSGATATQWETLEAMDVQRTTDATAAVVEADVVIDALLGYGLDGAPDDRIGEFVDIAAKAAYLVSLDVPSGVDATTGERPGVAVEPDRTLTLALPKTGLTDLDGPLYLGDIGIPAVVYEQVGIDYESPFEGEYVLPLVVE
ncbi:NAD(P)H-hydrate epimerase [Halapricum salinum]|uniref:NAD(P)H-hydrate epimerase n=2 Tax=Halapricum salinum TaxID=1457250 RepID=A0A4D6HJM8_9EURY|nr:NAD(P)H-hydrate epimerase [Halapricum salinum]